MEHPVRAVAVLLKAPVPGQVKTRLGAAVGMEAAARIHEATAREVLSAVARVTTAQAWVFHDPADAGGACRRLVPRRHRGRFRFRPQRGGSLGQRMADAFEVMFAEHGEGAVLVGADLPTLDAERVGEALTTLERREVVLGPAVDGGYYLIGLRRPLPAIFEGISWSTSSVLAATVGRCKLLGIEPAFLPRERDIDTLDDLLFHRRLLRERKLRREPVPAALLESIESAAGQRARRAASSGPDPGPPVPR